MKYSETPLIQQFHLEGVKHVAPSEAFFAIMSGEVIPVDVREDFEIELSAIDCERLLIHPIENILDSMSALPRDKALIIVCEHGVRSSKVANLLNIEKFSEVYNLDGGMQAWEETGLPVINADQHSCSGCSCGCH